VESTLARFGPNPQALRHTFAATALQNAISLAMVGGFAVAAFVSGFRLRRLRRGLFTFHVGLMVASV
jgi:FtsH-binding integral membrane protein